MKSLLTGILLLLGVTCVFAQNIDTLGITEHHSSSGVMIKWLPGNFNIWAEGFKNGYMVERHTMVIDAKGQWKVKSTKKLTPKPLMPWTQERFNLELGQDSSLKDLDILMHPDEISEAEIPENTGEAVEMQNTKDFTFLLGLFSTIKSNKAAEAMGLFLKDEDVSPGAKYLYRVKLQGEGKQLAADVFVDMSKPSIMPPLPGVKAKNFPWAVQLSWLKVKNSGYVYYNIYRSASKNGDYVKLNEYPYMGDMTMDPDAPEISYLDSFPELQKTYYYKIEGVNAFEITDPGLAPLEVKALYLLQKSPIIDSIGSPDNQSITIGWKTDGAEFNYIDGFDIFHSSTPDGPFVKVNSRRLGKLTQYYTDRTPGKATSNYYQVCVHGINGDSVCSYLKSLLLKDSIPPSIPVLLSGTCDTNGYVKLEWKKNTESDFEGYRVFRTYGLVHEPKRMTEGHILDTSFIDTVEVNSGYTHVYYGVVAVDKLFNASNMSEYLAIKIPDKMPPTNATFTGYQAGYSGITLTWIHGKSPDAKKLMLMKKTGDAGLWQTLQTYSRSRFSVTSYTDSSTLSNTWYEYRFITEDSSGLQSAPSQSVRVLQPEKNPFPVVKDLRGVVSTEHTMVKLSWEFPHQAKGFKIMRSVDGKPVETYDFISGSKREFYDKWLTPNTVYTYAVVAELEGNRTSAMSEPIQITY